MKLPADSIERVLAEFREAELGDARRTSRVVQVAEALSRMPGASLPEALRTEAQIEAGYRLFGNEAIDFDDLIHEHHERTGGRARDAKEVLVLHDTTTCSFKHIPPEELGYLQTGKGGFFLHVSLVVDAQRHRRPLGVVHAEAYWRNERAKRGGRKRRVSGKETASWKDREYLRWERGVGLSAERLEGSDAIHVIDREGDAYALLASLKAGDHRFVVRSRINRRLSDKTLLLDTLACCEGVMEREVFLSRRRAPTAPRARAATPGRAARTAHLRFKSATVTLKRPRSCDDTAPKELELSVVDVEEIAAPADEKPIRWTLWTSEPVETAEQVAQVVDNYRQRWLVEEFFKALKTGCKFEARQLQSRHALLNLLAISTPIAVELLWMRARVSDDPNAPASDIVTPLQLRILRTLGHRPLSSEPTAAQALLAIAGLGGHMRSNGPPGWQVLRRGYQKLLDYELGWTAARSEEM